MPQLLGHVQQYDLIGLINNNNNPTSENNSKSMLNFKNVN